MVVFLSRNFFIITALMQGSIFLANDGFYPALSYAADYFSVDVSYVQMSVSIFFLGALCFQLFIGPFSDWLGRKPLLILGSALYIVTTLVCIFSRSIGLFLFFRFFQGIAIATTAVNNIAAINEFYDEQKAVFGMSCTLIITMVFSMCGPIIGVFLLEKTEGMWQSIFIFNIIFNAISMVFLILCMPETLSKSKHTDRPFVQFYNVVKKIPAIINNKLFLVHSISIACGGFIMLLWLGSAPEMLIKNMGLSEKKYSFYQAIVYVFVILGNFLSPYFVKKISIKKIMNISHIIFLFIGIPTLLLMYVFKEHAIILIASVSSLLLILNILQSVKFRFIIDISEYKGNASGVLNQIAALGPFFGSMMAARLHGSSNIAIFLTMVIVLGFSGAISLMIDFSYRKK